MGFAALIVVGSLAITGWLLVTEFAGTDSEAPSQVVTDQAPPDPDNATEPVADPGDGSDPVATADDPPPPTPSTQTSGDVFKELRYLPAGSTADMRLGSIVRVPEGASLATFVRTERGRVDGILMIDAVAEPFFDGLGVRGLDQATVGEQPAVIAPVGPERSFVMRWRDPELGGLRAWGLGLTADEHIVTVNEIAALRDDGGAAAPRGWSRVENLQATAGGPIWRANYLSGSGEVLVIASYATPEAESLSVLTTDGCVTLEDGKTECVHALGWNDDDNVEIVVIGSDGRRGEFENLLRPAPVHNARVRQVEVDPYASIELDAAESLVYLPQGRTRWTMQEAAAHASGRPITTPALVLVERDTPIIGNVVSAVVVNVLQSGTADEEVEVGEGGLTRIVERKSGVLLEFIGWQHFLEEIALVAELVSITDDGLQYAGRAGTSIGIERSYETVYYSANPPFVAEGLVFAASYRNDDGDTIEQRISRVPNFSPEAVAIEPHDNPNLTIPLRGQTAGLIGNGLDLTLRWQERPGVLIELSGSVEEDLIEFAESLGADDADAIRARLEG